MAFGSHSYGRTRLNSVLDSVRLDSHDDDGNPSQVRSACYYTGYRDGYTNGGCEPNEYRSRDDYMLGYKDGVGDREEEEKRIHAGP